MAILFGAPVPVQAMVRGYRKHGFRPASFLAGVPVRVRAVGTKQAPLAMRATTSDGLQHAYRRIGNGLVRSLYVPTAEGPVAVTAENADRAMLAFAAHARAADSDVVWPFLARRVRTRVITRPDDWQEARETDTDDAIRLYRGMWMAEAVCVDGAVFVPSSGPAWVAAHAISAGGQVWQGTAHTAPWGAAYTPLPGLVAERSHLHDPQSKWVFAPGDLAIAEIRIREGVLAGEIGGHLAHVRWDNTFGEPRGTVDGPEIRVACASAAPAAAEMAAAAHALLRLAAGDLARMSPVGIHAYARLKAAADTVAWPETAADALSANEGFHAMWIAAGRAPDPSADPVAPLLARLRDTPPGGRPGRPDRAGRGTVTTSAAHSRCPMPTLAYSGEAPPRQAVRGGTDDRPDNQRKRWRHSGAYPKVARRLRRAGHRHG